MGLPPFEEEKESKAIEKIPDVEDVLVESQVVSL